MKRKPNEIRSIVDRLFDAPPINRAEMEHRLSRIDPRQLRGALVDRLEEQAVDGPNDEALYLEALNIVGIDDANLERLVKIASDASAEMSSRAAALGILSVEDPERMAAVSDSLSAEEAYHITHQGMVQLLELAQYDPQQVWQLMEMVASSQGESQISMLVDIELARQEIEAPAAAIYGPALRIPELAQFREPLLQRIEDDGGAEAVELLEELRGETRDPDWRKSIQRALLRLRTRSITPQASRPRSKTKETAYLGCCDGQGAFVMLACVPKKKNRYIVADICIRAAADIRDGFVIPSLTQAEMTEFIETVTRETKSMQVPVPMDVAAGIVKAGAARTKEQGVPVPADARSAMMVFSRVDPTDWRPHHDLEPAVNPSLDDYRKLLSTPPYSSWFFDAGDLGGVGLRPPLGLGKTPRSWFDEAAALLGKTSIRQRVAAMAEHHATWHALQNQTEEARLCLAAARDVRGRFEESPLIRAMLESSVDVPSLPVFDDSDDTTSNTRGLVRERFFQNVTAPKGRDVAELDLTTTAIDMLDKFIHILPGERRPRVDVQYEIGHAVGRLLAAGVGEISRSELEDRMIVEIMKVSQLTKSEAKSVTGSLLAGCLSFIDVICGDCPARCLERPDRAMPAAFYSDDIPGYSSEPEPRPKRPAPAPEAETPKKSKPRKRGSAKKRGKRSRKGRRR